MAVRHAITCGDPQLYSSNDFFADFIVHDRRRARFVVAAWRRRELNRGHGAFVVLKFVEVTERKSDCLRRWRRIVEQVGLQLY
jgi:hypothetical protein